MNRIVKQIERNRKQKEANKQWLSSKRKYKQAKRKYNRTKEEQQICPRCNQKRDRCPHYPLGDSRLLWNRPKHSGFRNRIHMIEDAFRPKAIVSERTILIRPDRDVDYLHDLMIYSGVY